MAERTNQQKLDDTQYILTTKDGQGTLGRAYGWYILHEVPIQGWNGGVSLAARIAGTDQAVNDIRAAVVGLTELVRQLTVKQGVTIDYAAIAKAVNDDTANRMKG